MFSIGNRKHYRETTLTYGKVNKQSQTFGKLDCAAVKHDNSGSTVGTVRERKVKDGKSQKMF